MDRKELMAQFNSPARMGTLSTSDGEGNINAAVFNSLQMVDEDTVVMAIGDNRSLANMRTHPKAVFLFFEPDPNPFDWQGARTYFDVVGIEEEGELVLTTITKTGMPILRYRTRDLTFIYDGECECGRSPCFAAADLPAEDTDHG